LLSLVPTPIGNIGDISLRAIELLADADILLCEDTRVTKKLIQILKDRYNTDFKPDQQFISLHSHNEDAFIDKLQNDLFEQNVVYVSDAGMPGISDPGAKLVDYCIKNNITYDVLPGANAPLSAFVASGFIQSRFLFFGFLDHKGNSRSIQLQEAMYNGYTTILYESPHRIEKLLLEIKELEPSRELFVAKELTKKFQRYIRGNADEILKKLAKNFKGEWVVVIKGAKKQNSSAITQNDILSLNIPTKAKAKLIHKITNENIKEIYQKISQL